MKPDTNKHRLYHALRRLVDEVEQEPSIFTPDGGGISCVISLSAFEQANQALGAARLNRRDPDAA
jgi:hypothetical protein